MARKQKKDRKKKKIILILIMLLAIVCIVRCGGAGSHRAHSEDRVVGYLPHWYSSDYDKIDYSALTHLNIAFVNPDSKGNLSISISEDRLRAIIKKAHRKDVKVLMALGGGNGYANYTNLTSTKAGRKLLNDNIMDYVKKYHFDGVDINVEGDVEPAFWDTYDAWVRGLAKRCSRENLILSCSTASWFDSYISDETFDRFDFISVMAYDNRGASNPASYDYAVSAMEYFEGRGIPKSRLVLGIPFYGYRYVDGYCTGKTVTYNEIATYNKGSEHYDESGTCRYNGIDTVKEKTAFAKEKYGGVMIWALGQDASGKKSLLRAIDEVMGN